MCMAELCECECVAFSMTGPTRVACNHRYVQRMWGNGPGVAFGSGESNSPWLAKRAAITSYWQE